MQESQEQQKSDNENIAHKPKKAPEKKKGRTTRRPTTSILKATKRIKEAGQERASEVESRQVKRNPQTVKQHHDENDS